MEALYMTAYGGTFLGPIAKLFGIIMNAIYNFFGNVVGIENVNIGFIIIIFTIVVYIILFPLTYQQQKFTNLQRTIQPELQAIQKKYKGKRDQATMLKQQEETQALYDKYGLSMTGSCAQMLIQLPILYALYGVFNNLPAYIDSVRNIFTKLADDITNVPNYTKIMNDVYELMGNKARVRVDFLDAEASAADLKNYVIDVVYKLSESGWDTLREKFADFSDIISPSTIDAAQNNLRDINYFFVLNISDTPFNIITTSFKDRNFLILIAALLIPVCSYLSQVLNLKLATVNSNNNGGNDAMAAQMQTMNKVMPLISLFFVFGVPIGLGLYWITGALFRSLCQWGLNKHFQKMDLTKIIEKNKEKAEAKAKKREKRNENMYAAATMKTKTMSDRAMTGGKNEEALLKAEEARSNAKPGSMASKANLVNDFNKRNNRK